MSENELVNKEGVEVLSEVGYSRGNGISKVVIVGAVIAVGVGTLMYIKNRKAKKAKLNETVVEQEIVSSKKTDK